MSQCFVTTSNNWYNLWLAEVLYSYILLKISVFKNPFLNILQFAIQFGVKL